MYLYKYAPPAIVDLVIKVAEQSVSIKFDYPCNYNDPLELFLTLSGTPSDDFVIAYYNTLLKEIPMMPTTCFSKRPDVIPMWAHYGMNQQGFALELQEDLISKNVEIGYLEDVSYAQETGTVSWSGVEFAARTLKPRHSYAVQTTAFRSAYFTKNACWSYEKERRLVISPAAFGDSTSMMIKHFPAECVASIICGIHSSDEIKEKLHSAAIAFGCEYYEMKIGRSSCTPYFVDRSNNAYVFENGGIEPVAAKCSVCAEPLPSSNPSVCRWCSIDESLQESAWSANPFTTIDALGLRKSTRYGFSFAHLKPIGRFMDDPNPESPSP